MPMSSVIDKLKSLKDQFYNDGSQEMIDSYIADIEEDAKIDAIRGQEGFKILIDRLKGAFHTRMSAVIQDDPELKSLYKVLRSMAGSETHKIVEQIIEEHLEDEPNELDVS